MGAIGVIRVASNDAIARAEAARRAPPPSQEQFEYPGLAGHIEKFWQAAQNAKQPIDDMMLRALRQRTGVYEPGELALIREQGGSEIYMMLTSAKCRAAESWLRDILIPDTDKPWGLEPSPMPELPPNVGMEIIRAVTARALAAGWQIDDRRIDEMLLRVKRAAMQRLKDLAKGIAEKHELKIEDQFEDGGFTKAMSDFIYDLVTFPAGFIKGPILRKQKTLAWVPMRDGRWVADVKETIVLQFERRSPFDIYPAPAMRDIQYGNFIDRHKLTREHLNELIGAPGYSDAAIKAVLDRYGEKGYNSRWMRDSQRAELELRRHEEYDPEGTIEFLNFWGSASGKMINEWNFQNGKPLETKLEDHREYQIEAWKCGGYIIKAAINENPLDKRPYYKASLEEIPGAFWGNGLPELIRDSQGMCNGAARAIANNASIASGPQVVIHVDRLADGERITKPYPWKVYQMTSDPQGSNRESVNFFQPQLNVNELLMIYNHFERVADNVSGFPNYTYGDAKVGGAGRTSSGLAQLMGNVGKGVRRVIQAVDINVMRPLVQAVYEYNMQYDPDPTLKGDLRPVARGASALLVKDQAQQRRREMLQATLNPMDAQIMGVKGRAELLRETVKALDMPVDKIVPDEADILLATAGMPPPYAVLGKTGPNASGPPAEGGGEGGEPGMTGGGGTPGAEPTLDVAGNRPNGVEQREQALGYRDGGAIRWRMRRSVDESGRAMIDVEAA